MSDEKLQPGQAASMALNTITQQIRMMAELPSESCKVAIAGLEPMVMANLKMVVDACNEQVDEMNAIITEVESRDTELLGQALVVDELRSKLAEVQGKIDGLETDVFNVTRARNNVEAKLGAANNVIKNLESEIKAYKALDPSGMKRRIKEKNDLLEEQRKAISRHKSTESEQRRTILGLEDRVKELIDSINMQRDEITRQADIIMEVTLQREFEVLWADHLNKNYFSESGERWNVYLGHRGLVTNKSYLLNDLNWKLMAMRQDGTGCIVMVSEWLTPIFPLGDVGRDIPMEAVKDAHRFICDAVGKTHPHLVERAEWGQTVSIRDVGLSDKLVSLLEASSIKTLWDAMAYGNDKLLGIKGLGQKTVGVVVNACELAIKAWERSREQEAAA